jgi:hypothetical protein
MTERITKKNIISLFKLFTKERKIPTSATWYKNKRRFSKKWLKLDYNQYYGGWRMDWVNKDTSESFYAGNSRRRSTREMYNYLQGLIHRK